jgi:SAM-dependent methyltransferase
MAEKARSYRDRFVDSQEATSYDEGEYSPGTYHALLSRLEQGFLEELTASLRHRVDQVDYLDFACGTGRIIAFMEPLVDSATGLEISPAMLERARAKVRDARLLQGDITKDPALLGQSFDLITAFRFVLNAEPQLRVDALRRLAGLLRDENSVLVFNSHINLWSHKLLTWPSQRIFARQEKGNFLTFRQVKRITAECGLVVERGYGCGLLSRRALRLMDAEKLFDLERKLAQRKVLQRFGSDQVYVARRRDLDPATGA